ncbi:MAG: hypothetical protein AB1938_25980 [Myxococcota bacterium]
MPRVFAFALLAATGCATLNTAGMSEHCRNMYNACLDVCAKSRLPPTAQPQQLGNSSNWQMEVAQCTDGCNKQAKSCQ